MVKKAICSYYNISLNKSQLKIYKKNFLGLRGDNIHCYFILRNDKVKHRVFGKIASNNQQEYHNLQYLIKNIPKKDISLPRPIALLKNGDYSLLLLEYLEGYSNPFSAIHSVYPFNERIFKILKVGKNVLNKIYRLQKHFQISYSPLTLYDTDGIPNQPKPVSIFKQLESVQSISDEIKAKLENKINEILKNRIMVRRGMIHGDLGLRNIIINSSKISFIDWDCMQHQGTSLLDPCYFVTLLLMRSVQLLIPKTKANIISESLFQHIKQLEERLTETKYENFISDGIWFGKCIAITDTLWWYEQERHNNFVNALIKRRNHQIKYLAYHLEKVAKNEHCQ